MRDRSLRWPGGRSRGRPPASERGLPRRRVRPPPAGADGRAGAAGEREAGAEPARLLLRGRRRGRRGHPAGQPRGVRQVGRRPPGAAGREPARHLRRAVRTATPRPAAARPGGRAGTRARRGRPGGGAGRGVARRADGLLQPGVGVDGGVRRGDGRRPPLVPAVLVDVRRTRREPARPGRGGGLRRARGHPRHHDARLASPRPRPRAPAVRARQGHRAVHVGPGVPPAGRGAGGRGR